MWWVRCLLHMSRHMLCVQCLPHMSLHMLWGTFCITYVPTCVVRYVPHNICRDMCRVMCCHDRHMLVLVTYVWFPQHKSSFKSHVGTCASKNAHVCLGYPRLRWTNKMAMEVVFYFVWMYWRGFIHDYWWEYAFRTQKHTFKRLFIFFPDPISV